MPVKEPIVTLNGRVCCVLGLTCCIPPQGMAVEQAQEAQLAHIIRAASRFEISRDDAQIAAKAILEHVDLVPKGVGSAIVQGYARWLIPADSNSAGKDQVDSDSGGTVLGQITGPFMLGDDPTTVDIDLDSKQQDEDD